MSSNFMTVCLLSIVRHNSRKAEAFNNIQQQTGRLHTTLSATTWCQYYEEAVLNGASNTWRQYYVGAELRGASSTWGQY